MKPFPPDNNTLHQYFTGLVIAEIALIVLTLPVMLFSDMMTETATEDSIGASEASAPEMAIAFFAVLLLIVYIPAVIASWVGLFNYKAWGRWLYLATTVFEYVLFLPLSIFDLSWTWGLESSLHELASTISGAILTIAYLTPLANRFTEPVAASYVHS